MKKLIPFALLAAGAAVAQENEKPVLVIAAAAAPGAAGGSVGVFREEGRLRYLAPARYDDLLLIDVWLTVLTRVRLNFGYRVLNQAETAILEASTFHVCTGLDEKPKRLPSDLSILLQPYLTES